MIRKPPRLNHKEGKPEIIARAFLRFRSPRDFLLFPPPYYAGALASLLRAKHAPPASSIGWGWKLPETYLFLPYVKAVFPKVKYIHVIRHGLDMAYSRNQHQFWAWGAYFGIRPQRSVKLFPKALRCGRNERSNRAKTRRTSQRGYPAPVRYSK